MKPNDIFIVIATLAYSYLFYDQNPGINFLLFSVLIIILLFLNDKSIITKPSWLVAASGTLLSSFSVFWWGTELPALGNICSLSIIAGLSFNPESSIIVASINTGISIITSIPRFITQSVKSNIGEGNSDVIGSKMLILMVPLIVSMIFVIVYRESNPIFKQFTDQINLDFISFNWCAFTLMAFFIMYGVFKYFPIPQINDADKKAGDDLPVITLEQHLLNDFGLSVSNEVLTGVILLLMLNIVLLCVNGLDMFYLWIASRLPDGITPAAYVHDGANTLIFSIIMAIGIILFVFRGYLNFYENNRWLKTLAYAWIAQNALLVITTANRNYLLIESSGLTRRRIGVYVYLLLCLIGLTTTIFKVLQRKSNWFLFRKNGWIFYVVFIVSCFINWDELIVNYQCKNGNDRLYQSDLSHTSLATLFGAWAKELKEPDKEHREFTSVSTSYMLQRYFALKTELESSGWQSYCVSKRRNIDEVDRMIKTLQVPTAVSSTN